jgi:hypothetical protein
MSVGLRGGLVRARAVGPEARRAVVGVSGVSWSGGGLEADCVAECFELFDEPAGAVFD